VQSIPQARSAGNDSPSRGRGPKSPDALFRQGSGFPSRAIGQLNPVKAAVITADTTRRWANHLAEGVYMRYLIALTVLIFAITLLCPAAYADGDTKKSDEDTPKLVRSKRERKAERMTNWIEGLEGDKARIYELYGYPSGKYREEVMGTVVERWVYPDHGVTFKFKGNKLIR
jgi:hypothetical protein